MPSSLNGNHPKPMDNLYIKEQQLTKQAMLRDALWKQLEHLLPPDKFAQISPGLVSGMLLVLLLMGSVNATARFSLESGTPIDAMTPHPSFSFSSLAGDSSTPATDHACTDYALADGDVVTCEMTSSDLCAGPATTNSNVTMMTVETVPTYEVIETTTNGCLLDGIYAFTGVENGKPKYVHSSENFFSIFWDGAQWVVDDFGSPLYINTADTPLPPCEGWDLQGFCSSTFSLVSGCLAPACPPAFMEASANPFEQVTESSVAFADVDGDMDMDVLITGDNSTFGGLRPGEERSLMTGPLTKLYTNDGSGIFTEATGTPFDGVFRGSAAFADVDGDMDLDVLITGSNTSFTPSAKLYTNNGGTFTEVTGTPFDGVESGSIAFADVDGDMDMDVLITGNNASFTPSAKLYTNNGGTFTEVTGTPFTGVANSSIAFADVDGDLDQDVLVTGRDGNNNRITKLYTNSGNGTFTEVSGTPFTGVANSSITFADVNGDTYPDVLITGRDNSNTRIAKLYTNDGSGTFTEVPATTFEGVINGDVAFADLDGDSDLDVLISGQDVNFENITKLYINDGSGIFAEATGSSLEGIARGGGAFADVDGDMDMDLILTGENAMGNPFTQLYLNDNSASVSITADPGNNIASGTSVTFTATPTNGGSTPSYQWKVNGSNVGSDQDTYTSTTLADGDVVTCEMTSSDPCADPAMATSNTITMTVTNPCGGVANRIYVTPTGTGNGSSWANATSDLQAAIDNTCGVTEIWMAAGTYKPAAYPTGCTTCTIPREYAFMLKDNIKIYGGFAGTETMLSERTPGNETILSGDVDNNDTWDNGNAYHILIALNVSGVVLDGLTIQHGYTAETSGWHDIEGIRVFKQDGPVYIKKVNAFTINEVKFVENYGDRYSGALYVEETGGVCSITNCQFTDNDSNSGAGGLYLEYSGVNGGYTNIDSCQFTNNEASSYGGAIYAYSEANDTISNCQFTGNSSEEGGALYIAYQTSGTATTITGCTFENNNADDGGAVYIYAPEGNYIFEDCQFNGNSGIDYAGAVYMVYSGYNYDNYTSFRRCSFTENGAEYGGAIYSEESYGNDMIDSCQFNSNNGTYYGGAIYLLYSGYNEDNYTSITNSSFNSNNSDYGGAIYSEESYGNDIISNCQFINNSSTDDAGAIYLLNTSENDINFTTVMDCQFTGNTSEDEGGAIRARRGEGTQIIRSSFLDNEAIYGGAITIYDDGALISDCLFAKNKATSDDIDYGAGGAIFSDAADLSIINSTFAENIATLRPGGGVTCDDELTLSNCIFWGNVQQGDGTLGQQQVYNNGGTVNIAYSLLQDGFPTDATDDGNNLYLDPLFTDAASNDYTLTSCSPAINTGNNTGVSATDLSGNTRIENGTVDMGAYEKATTAVGEIECITFGGFTTCNGDMTYVNEDDFASGSVTVKFSSIPASGTLDLSSSALVGTASVDVSALSGDSYTFNSVKLLATGQEAEVTASFSDNSGSASEMIATPLPCSRYVFTGTGNWDVPTNWQDNNQPATSGNNRHFTYLGDAVIHPGMSITSIGDSVLIEMGGSLDIQQSVTFSKSTANTGGFENNGTVTLTGNGTATYFIPLYNNGGFTIDGGANGLSMSGPDANLFNAGTITNLKRLTSFANITNLSTGVIDNQAGVSLNTGVFTNEGEFTHNWPGNTVSWFMGVNNSGIFNVAAGTIEFNQSTDAFFTNSGTVTNEGTTVFNSSPTLTNEADGTFNNTGTMTLRKGMTQNGMFLNDVDGTLKLEFGNVGMENNGTLTNNGTIEQKDAAFFRNNNLVYQNATLICSAFSLFENNDSLLVPAGALIDITGSGFVFDNTATGTFILDGTMAASNQNSSQFSNNGILKGNGTLDNSAGRIFDNNASGSIQPGASPGTLTIHKLNNIGNIDIEIGGTTPYMEHDMLDLPTSSTLGGTLNVTLVYGFEPACSDAFDIILHASNTGTFSTLNLPEGFSVEYLADKVVLSYGQIGISIDNISEADCGNTTCTTDDTFTADVTVTYGYLPGSGTLTLTGPTLAGSAPAVNVADLTANAYTFTGVTLAADGSDIDLTAAFSDGCDYNDSSLGTAPECGGTFTPADITVSGFGCFGPNGTYTFVGYEGGAPVWQSQNDFFIGYVEGEWAILSSDFSEEVTLWSTNPNGSVDNLPCNDGWTDPFECALSPGAIALSGGCGNLGGGSGPACELTDIALSNTSACDDNGTISSTDDYFTADVTVTFAYAPSGATLTLQQGNTVLESTSEDLTCTTSYTFMNVQLPANGQEVVLSASFSSSCTYTSEVLMTAPEDCSCQPTSEFTACPDYLQVNVDAASCSAVVSYDVIADGAPVPDYTYAFTGATIGSGDGTGTGHTFEVGLTTVAVTATNACGEATCQFDITVTDNLPPDAHCLNTEVDLGPEGVYHLQLEDVFDASMSADNCLIAEVDFTDAVFTCDEEGFTFPIPVSVSDLSGNSDNCTAQVTVVSSGKLPAPWQTADIGDHGEGSDYAYDPCTPPTGVFNIQTEAYNLIPLNEDNVAFIGQELCNDGGIQVRIDAVEGGYAGIMIRESDAPGAKMVAMYSNLTNLLRWETRYTTNGMRNSGNFYQAFPIHLRLRRDGDLIRGFFKNSNTGGWILVHQVYLPMNECVEMGMAVFTTDPNGQASATFSRVRSRSNLNNEALVMPDDIQPSFLQEWETMRATVFPNPNHGMFTIAFDQPLETDGVAILRNGLGQEVSRMKLQAGHVQTEWERNQLLSGLYFLDIVLENGHREVLKVICEQR